MFERRPTAPDEDTMRQQLWDLWKRQQEDPNSVTAADWGTVTNQLGAMVDEHVAAEHQRQLPWVLDSPADPGVEPGAVEAMTAPAPWTPRQPTETEQALAELDQLQDETADYGDDAA
jgi:hypothetical protein